MSPERTGAYGRVIRTLQDLGPSKLWQDEQERIRDAVDTLIFSTDLRSDPSAQEALDDAERLCRDLVASGRWEQVTAVRLVDDIRACGPVARVAALGAA
jgi:hypothetical protein